MGFSYRKSVKMGPFRVTASKSGISYSAGVKGVRVTKRAKGKVQTTLSAPGTGLRYTSTSGGKTRKPPRQGSTTVQSTQRAAPTRRAARRPSPAAARNAASSRKPVRLRGRRSTTPPRVPPAPLLPVTIKGNLATITIHQGGIHIERTRAGKINGNRSADIHWRDLVGVDFLDPSFFRNGHVHFATLEDPRGLTTTGNGNYMAATARNPHAVMFAWHQSRAYRQLRGLLTATTGLSPGRY